MCPNRDAGALDAQRSHFGVAPRELRSPAAEVRRPRSDELRIESLPARRVACVVKEMETIAVTPMVMPRRVSKVLPGRRCISRVVYFQSMGKRLACVKSTSVPSIFD